MPRARRQPADAGDAKRLADVLAACPPLWGLLDQQCRHTVRAASRHGRACVDSKTEHLAVASPNAPCALPLSVEGLASLAGLQRRGCSPASLGLLFAANGANRRLDEARALQVLRACAATVRSLSIKGSVPAGVAEGVRAALPQVQQLRLCDTVIATPAGPTQAAADADASDAAGAAAGSSTRRCTRTAGTALSRRVPNGAAVSSGLVAALAPALTRLHLSAAVDNSWAPVLRVLGACSALETLHVVGSTLGSLMDSHKPEPPFQADAYGALTPALVGLSRLTALHITGVDLLPRGVAALGQLATISRLTGLHTLTLWFPPHHKPAAAASLANCMLSMTAPLLHLRSLDVGGVSLSCDTLGRLSAQHSAITYLGFASLETPSDPSPQFRNASGAYSALLPAGLRALRIHQPDISTMRHIAALAPTDPQRTIDLQASSHAKEDSRCIRLTLEEVYADPNPLSAAVRAEHMRAVARMLRGPLAAAAARRDAYHARPDDPSVWDAPAELWDRHGPTLWVVGDLVFWKRALRGPHCAWLRELSPIGAVLGGLLLQGLDLSHGELPTLAGACPGLWMLAMMNCQVPAADLPRLATMPALKYVSLNHVDLCDWISAPGAEASLLALCLEAPQLGHFILKPAEPQMERPTPHELGVEEDEYDDGAWGAMPPYDWDDWWEYDEPKVRAVVERLAAQVASAAGRNMSIRLQPPSERA